MYVCCIGGKAGLILSYALKSTQSLSFAVRSSTALENLFTSPERVIEYIELEQEDNINHNKNENINETTHLLEFIKIDDSIHDGSILSGRNITVKYSSDSKPVLKSLNFDIKDNKLYVVCGRTGISDNY